MQADLMAKFGIKAANKATFPFLAKGSSFSHDKVMTESGSDDWFGKAAIRADLVLKDLRAIVNPVSVTNLTKDSMLFFRNISRGDGMSTISTADCKAKNGECAAFLSQAPLPIGQAIDSAGSITDTDDPVGLGGSPTGSGAGGVATGKNSSDRAATSACKAVMAVAAVVAMAALV
jgi:hypothetical protein